MLKFKTSCAVLAYLSSNLLNEVGLSLFRYFEVGLRVCDIVVKKFTFVISSPDEFLFDITADSCTRGHSMKMVKRHCHTDLRLYFFSNRVVSRWNTLSQDIVSAPSVNSFKRHLNILRQKKMGFFMDSWSA